DPVMDVPRLDGERPRAEHPAESIRDPPAVRLARRDGDQPGRLAREVEPEVSRPAGSITERVAGDRPARIAVAVEVLEDPFSRSLPDGRRCRPGSGEFGRYPAGRAGPTFAQEGDDRLLGRRHAPHE